MTAKDKVLCLLYIKDGQSASELQSNIEYKNTSNFRRILNALHNEKLIEFSNEKCMLSPIGIQKVEMLLGSY